MDDEENYDEFAEDQAQPSTPPEESCAPDSSELEALPTLHLYQVNPGRELASAFDLNPYPGRKYKHLLPQVHRPTLTPPETGSLLPSNPTPHSSPLNPAPGHTQ